MKNYINSLNYQLNTLQKNARNEWNDMQLGLGTITPLEHTVNNIKYGITDTVEVLGDLSEAFFGYLDNNSN